MICDEPRGSHCRDRPLMIVGGGGLGQRFSVNFFPTKLVKIGQILAFSSEKCQQFLPFHHYFHLSRTGGQPVISIAELAHVRAHELTFRKFSTVLVNIGLEMTCYKPLYYLK